MSKIGTTNIQNIKCGTGTIKEVRIGTSVYWSNVPPAMPPFSLDDWNISGGTTTGGYSLTLSNGKLVQKLLSYSTNWNNCTITSNELRTARQISINYTVTSNDGNSEFGEMNFIIEAKNGNTWTEVARKTASCVSGVGTAYQVVNNGTYTDTINVSTTASRMRIKVGLSVLAYSGNRDTYVTYNTINFS